MSPERSKRTTAANRRSAKASSWKRAAASPISVAARSGEPPAPVWCEDVDLPGVVGQEGALVDAHALGEATDRADVGLRGVVREECPVEVLGRSRAAQVVRGGQDRVTRLVDVAAHAVETPCGRQE